jgi:hypothetical protein
VEVTTPEQSCPADDAMQEDAPTRTKPSSVNIKVEPYAPSSPLERANSLSQYMATFSDEQRESIAELMSTTKQPLNAAVDALTSCEWDLLDAVAVFGGDAWDEDEDGGDDGSDDGSNDGEGAQEHLLKRRVTSQGAISRGSPDVRDWSTKEEEKKSYGLEYWTPTRRFSHLRKRWYNRNHTQGWPQNPRNAAFQPITLRFLPSSPNTHIVPKFMSPYGDRKLWYTGFMGP